MLAAGKKIKKKKKAAKNFNINEYDFVDGEHFGIAHDPAEYDPVSGGDEEERKNRDATDYDLIGLEDDFDAIVLQAPPASVYTPLPIKLHSLPRPAIMVP